MNMRALLFLVFAIHTAVAQSTLYTVENNGPRSQRINIVFLSEAYSAADLANFSGHVSGAMNSHACSVITTCTSHPRFTSLLTRSAALYAAMLAVTPTTTNGD